MPALIVEWHGSLGKGAFMARIITIGAVLLVCIPHLAWAEDNDFVTTQEQRGVNMGVSRPQIEQEEAASEDADREAKHDKPVEQNKVAHEHPVPQTPPGWDSLTTGEANGGGVIGNTPADILASKGILPSGNQNFGTGFGIPAGGFPYSATAGINYNNQNYPLGAVNMNAPALMANMRQPYGSSAGLVQDGDLYANQREQEMTGALLASLLQYIMSQPNGQQVQPYYNQPTNLYTGARR